MQCLIPDTDHQSFQSTVIGIVKCSDKLVCGQICLLSNIITLLFINISMTMYFVSVLRYLACCRRTQTCLRQLTKYYNWTFIALNLYHIDINILSYRDLIVYTIALQWCCCLCRINDEDGLDCFIQIA